jgi:hypothetical protein
LPLRLSEVENFAGLLTEHESGTPCAMRALSLGYHRTFAQQCWQALPSFDGRLRNWLVTAGVSTEEDEIIFDRAEALRVFPVSQAYKNELLEKWESQNEWLSEPFLEPPCSLLWKERA